MAWWLFALTAASFAYSYLAMASNKERIQAHPTDYLPLHTVGSAQVTWIRVAPVSVRCEACGKTWEMRGANSIEREEVEHAIEDCCNGRVVECG